MENLVYFNDLLDEDINYKHIPYVKLLCTYEWKEVRDLIIARDKYTCRICNKKESLKDGKFHIIKSTIEEHTSFIEEYSNIINTDCDEDFPIKPRLGFKKGSIDKNPVVLNVHHTFYILDHLPWEYDKESLITVCQNCHNQLHQSSNIPTYKDDTKTELYRLTPCERCHGMGFIEKFHYHENGICFSCNGNKFIEYC